ncbi:hypothetical protein DMUE_2570 [Dictyocoela muelleri]|nr:hypothetical protein DMUE_2570 [Dictyocoela muelleri]
MEFLNIILLVAIIILISFPKLTHSSNNSFVTRNSNTNETYSQNDSSPSKTQILSNENSESTINNLSRLVNQSISFGEMTYSKTKINDGDNISDKEISDDITADSDNYFLLSGNSSENIYESDLPDFSAPSQNNLSNVTKTGEVEEPEISKSLVLDLFHDKDSNSSKITIASIKNEKITTFNNLTAEKPNLIQNGKTTVLLENSDYSEIGIPDTLTTENPIFYSMQIEAPPTIERENNISSNISNRQKRFAIGSFGENLGAEEVTEGERNSIIKEGFIPANNYDKGHEKLEYGSSLDEGSGLGEVIGLNEGSGLIEGSSLNERSGLIEGSGLNDGLGLSEVSGLIRVSGLVAGIALKEGSGLDNGPSFE